MFGDFGQLPPVLNLSMYTNNLQELLSNDDFAAYKLFREVYKLDVIQRQSGNSREQQNFRDILLRLRNREFTLDDWKTLTTRLEDKLSRTERDSFSNAMFILTKWSDVDIININQLRSLNSPIAKI